MDLKQNEQKPDTSLAQTAPTTATIESNSLILVSPEEELIQQAKRLYAQHKAYNTKRVYASDWKIFNAWCTNKNLSPEKADYESIALFLTDEFTRGRHPQTLTRRLAAIKWAFTQKQLPSPTEHQIVRNLLKGIRRDMNVKPSQIKKAITTNIVKEMADNCSRSHLRGIRDKAILLLGFSGAFRRSELSNLTYEDLSFHDKGIDILIKRSKTDQEGTGKIKAIIKAKEEKYCPCKAINQWLEKSHITTGPLFRGITKNDKIKKEHLSEDQIYELVKTSISQIGYELDEFSPHSLRSGFITSALEANALLSKIMDITHQVSFKSMQPYIKHADRYKQHAGENLL